MEKKNKEKKIEEAINGRVVYGLLLGFYTLL